MKFKHAKDEEHGKDEVLKETRKGQNENYKYSKQLYEYLKQYWISI